MKFAQARELITPNIRTHMSGYANRTDMFEGIHDDFYVKTLYIENKGTKFLIITYDLCHYTYDLNKRVMAYAAGKFEMPYENILVNYSHTHLDDQAAVSLQGDLAEILPLISAKVFNEKE